MKRLDELYPPSPANIPLDVVKPSLGYRLQVLGVLLSLIAFVAIYLGLIAGSAYLSYYSFRSLGDHQPAPRFRGGRADSGPTIFFVALGIGSAILCLFLLKSLFKRNRFDNSLDVEIHERDQPLLFAFIRRLCQETNTKFPHRIFVNYQVNAAVFYNQSIGSLFLPTHKNLLIGLGLVNRLNLSEFKAVLAHEFGHFSQNSMKFGTYVYTSNRIIADVVYGRDWLDDVLDHAKTVDIRIAIFVWIFLGALWGVRKSLEGLFTVINHANSALMRKMEFNADLMAYRVAGSDAIAQSLAKLAFADESLAATSRELFHAGDHQLYTRDLFYHQTRNFEFLRKALKDPTRGEPPPLPDDPTTAPQIFQPGDDIGIPLMWMSHPSNYDREKNVKERYVRSIIDPRPCWLLFDHQAELREEVTRKYYAIACKMPDVELMPPEKVQAFIDAEHEETTYDERFHGAYDEGFIGPGDLAPLKREADAEYASPGVLALAEANLFNDGVKAYIEGFRKRRLEHAKLQGILSGQSKEKTFLFGGETIPARRAQEFAPKMQHEMEADQKWFDAFDRSVFKIHYALARQVGEPTLSDLLGRYDFHLRLQNLFGQFQHWLNQLQHVVNQFAGQRNIEQSHFQAMVQDLRTIHLSAFKLLDEADKLTIPSLKNMPAHQNLGKFLWSKEALDELPEGTQSIDGAWVGALFQMFAEVLDKSRRILLKSMGGLLSLQSDVARRWRGMESPPASNPPRDTSAIEAV